MAASSHQSGEVAASVEAVADVLDHLTATTHQVHLAIARRGLVGALPMPVRSAQDAVTEVVYGIVRAGIAVAGRAATLTLESVERTRIAQPWTGTPRGRRLAGIEPDPAALARHYPAESRPDACVLANNHVMDFGHRGLEDTLEVLAKAGLCVVGAGHNEAEAWRPAVIPLPEGGRMVVHSFGTASSGIPRGARRRRGHRVRRRRDQRSPRGTGFHVLHPHEHSQPA